MQLTKIALILVINLHFNYAQDANLKNFKVLAELNVVDFVFPRSDVRTQAIQNGLFVQNNCIPIDVEVDYQENLPSRIFVTIPRFNVGIPVTLGYLSGSHNLIQPYPEYSWHSSHGRNCDGITSVFRVAVSTISDSL